MVIGLTGGIGSGKSIIAKLFELLGCAVFNSDQVAKEVYFDAQIRPKIIKLLGKEAYLNDHVLNKNHISSKIFSDTLLLQQLNGIIHPAVIRNFKTFVNHHSGQLVIKETALLFEAHLEKEVDKIIVVAADDAIRIKRVMARDGLDKESVQKKIQSQLLQEEKIKGADFVIYNNEDTLVIPQVLQIYKQLKP